MAANQLFEDALQAYLVRVGPDGILRLLKSDSRIDRSSDILPGEKREVEFTSDMYYVYRSQNGTNYSLNHVSKRYGEPVKYIVHAVRQNLDDLFDPVTGSYKGLWNEGNMGDLGDLDYLG